MGKFALTDDPKALVKIGGETLSVDELCTLVRKAVCHLPVQTKDPRLALMATLQHFSHQPTPSGTFIKLPAMMHGCQPLELHAITSHSEAAHRIVELTREVERLRLELDNHQNAKAHS